MPRRQRFGKWVGGGCWLYLTAMAGCWALSVVADRWWPATLFMFGPKWPLALPLAALLPAALWLRRRALVPLALAAGLWVVPIAGMALNIPSAERGDVRVLTFNIHGGRLQPARFAPFLQEMDPDVVLIQAWTSRFEATLFGVKSGGNRWHTRRDGELFVASRWPIRETELVVPANRARGGIAARYELTAPRGPLHVFNLHLSSPHVALDAFLDRDFEEGIPLLQANSRHRRDQSAAVSDRARELVGPVVIAGDFNTPPESALFRDCWPPFEDAFSASGLGWGYTYFTRRGRVRIDHVLVSPACRVRGCRIGPEAGSPHRPVVVDWDWPAGEPNGPSRSRASDRKEGGI